MPYAARIAEFLLDTEAVKLSVQEPFTWTSGIKSPIYCDNRTLYGHAEARDFVVDALVKRVQSLHISPDAIAGTATAAIGWGALVADRMDLPFCYVRSKPKEHGTKKRIEGYLRPNSDVVVIEDLISTGGSSISTVGALREEGECRVADVVAIFSYEMDTSREVANEASVQLHPLTSIATLLDTAVDQDRITEEESREVVRFLKNPQEWAR